MNIDEIEEILMKFNQKELFNRIRLELLMDDEWKNWRRINVKKALRQSCKNYQELKCVVSEYQKEEEFQERVHIGKTKKVEPMKAYHHVLEKFKNREIYIRNQKGKNT